MSTDRIGVTALRAAFLLDAWEAAGGMVDRSGLTGPVVEVYPAAARRLWGMGPSRSVDELEAHLPILFTDQAVRRTCTASEHAFDALISALVARASALARTDTPPARLRELAQTEGWIHIPTCSLGELVQERLG